MKYFVFQNIYFAGETVGQEKALLKLVDYGLFKLYENKQDIPSNIARIKNVQVFSNEHIAASFNTIKDATTRNACKYLLYLLYFFEDMDSDTYKMIIELVVSLTKQFFLDWCVENNVDAMTCSEQELLAKCINFITS